jgi:hypothetical protein
MWKGKDSVVCSERWYCDSAGDVLQLKPLVAMELSQARVTATAVGFCGCSEKGGVEVGWKVVVNVM